ncbi:MAG TPA: VOC family protein [Vicinamibacterales bacterium]|nr:VOC family protein [Vicinamibacterales bacterium]
MTRTSRRALVAVAAACGLWMIEPIAVGHAQAPSGTASDKGAVIGTGTLTGFVENMDRSLAFYHDAFGMEVPALPASGERPYNNPNPRLFAMFDIAGARERHQSARVSGTRVSVELMEIQNVDHTTIPMRSQDPGTATLVLIVRDLDAALARARQANAPIATPGGSPVRFDDGTRAILIRDLDTRLIELRQPSLAPASTDPAASNIVDMRLSIGVSDLSHTTRVYRDVLGFTVEGETPFAADRATRALTGLTKAEVRRARVQAPGSTLWIEFVEYKGVDREPHRMRIQDRGAARLQIRAQNVDELVDAMKRAGLSVVSEGGTAVPIPPNFKGALVADPNGFFLTPFAPCDNCAPTGRGRGQI